MTTVVLVLARAFHIGSAMMLVALPFFILVIMAPVQGADSTANYNSLYQRMIKWLWGALILETLSGFIWFWFVTAQMSDQSPWGILDAADLNTVLWQTQFGQLWLGRAAIGIALGLALYFASRKQDRMPPKSFLLDWLILIISGVLLITLAWAGHAAAGIHFHVLHLFADTLHLLIGAIWPIGLIPMVFFLSFIRGGNQIVPSHFEIKVVQRFSRVSFLAVCALVTTGLVNGWLMIGTWSALVTTTYGWLLLGKVLVVVIMIGLGAINRLYLIPRLETAPTLAGTLQRIVLIESILAALVLSIVAMMGMTSPPS